MFKNFSLVFVFLLSLLIDAQNEVLISILDNDTKQPISNVNIKINGSNSGFISNHKGEFIIKSIHNFKSTDTLVISHIQYFTEEITIENLKTLHYTILLLQKTTSLNEIVVETKREQKRKQLLEFNKITTMPKGLFAFGAEIIDGKVLITGGEKSAVRNTFDEILYKDKFNEFGSTMEEVLQNYTIESNWKTYNHKVFSFEFDKNNWSEFDKKIIKRAFHNSHIYNNKLYIIGGKRISNLKGKEYLENRIEILDLDNNTILVDKVNPHKAANFASFIYKDHLLVMGGSIKSNTNGIKAFSNEVHTLNLQTGVWHKVANMPIPKETQGILIEDTIYLIGGYNNNPIKSIETFNVTTGKWMKEGEMFESMANPGVIATENSIYIFNNGTFFTYNTQTRRFNEYNIKLNLHAPKIFLNKDKLYLFGGFTTNDFSKTPSNSVYSIDLSEFKTFKVINSKIL